MSAPPTHDAKGAPPEVVTFGCRLNAFESEVMREHARAAGWRDTIIVNTCAVTGEAERQARQAIRRLRRENPQARIVVTGCAAQIDSSAYGAMPEVDRVLGNAEKMRRESYLEDDGPRIAVGALPPDTVTLPLIDDFAGRARAFIEIQQGCDHHCTFCVIPRGRGPNRSAAPTAIVEQTRRLVEHGCQEIVLTGVDICSYGHDVSGHPGLGSLARTLLAEVPELPRLRLTSLDPAAIDDELLSLVADEERLMPHFHLSAQAGDDTVLKRMGRRHTRADMLALAGTLRRLRPGCAIGADLIAGFPTETDAMFGRTADLIDEIGFSHLHVFPYSPRPGTPAARMPQLSRAVAKNRAAILRARGQGTMDAFLATRVGETASVLVEKEGFGHCQHYLPVRLDGADRPGRIVAVPIDGVAGGRLIAKGAS